MNRDLYQFAAGSISTVIYINFGLLIGVLFVGVVSLISCVTRDTK